jgi:hypothetical protein
MTNIASTFLGGHSLYHVSLFRANVGCNCLSRKQALTANGDNLAVHHNQLMIFFSPPEQKHKHFSKLQKQFVRHHLI